MLEGFFVDAAHSFMANEKPAEEKKEEGFESMYGPAMGAQGDLANMIGRVLALLFVLLLISFFGQYFWNNYVTSLLTIAKPAKSVMQILGLFIFLRLMFP
jgi:hypothetical protein